MKGIILAAGLGTRLHPLTLSTSKQLLPVYDKPMIYYPISTLLLAGVCEILIIVNPHQRESFEQLLGNGEQWGVSITYGVQDIPAGLPDAFIIGEEFLAGEGCAMILGDNLFYGAGVGESLIANSSMTGAIIYCQEVSDPERYGVVSLDSQGMPIEILEKPRSPRSNLAVTGLYFLDSSVTERAKALRPSARGELEMADLLTSYLMDNLLTANLLERGTVWLDTGTFDSLAAASEFVKVVQQRQGLRISCPEEVAWRTGLITSEQLRNLSKSLSKSEYGQYLKSLVT
jgi:glucose-1-phosphate thymidylyltransferase